MNIPPPSASDAPWNDREREIPLPGKEDGYAKILLVGATGSGKTTLVRQLMGTHPDKERFPSTSTAKTTVCDIEIVLAESPEEPFRACVSFWPRERVRLWVEECVTACAATFIEADFAPGCNDEARRRLLESPDQQFRLNYLLGDGTADEDEDGEEEELDLSAEEPAAASVTAEERRAMAQTLQGYLEEIRAMAGEIATAVAEQLDIQKKSDLPTSDRDTFNMLVEDELAKDECYQDIVRRLVDEIATRFETIAQGELQESADGWPTVWTWESDTRPEFIRSVNLFSSNHAPLFGKLLTPLVQGLRVRGPFVPTWHTGELPRLVLLDGQGIGHTADSTTSVSTNITRRFELADIILLVDNAQQPLQAASCAVLSSVAQSGNARKLWVGFTHFDEVQGANFRGEKARKNHVTGSFDNAVHDIGRSLGPEAQQSLKKLVPERLLFLECLDRLIPKEADAQGKEGRLSRNNLESILEAAQQAILPPPPESLHPVYDVAHLIVAIGNATRSFHEKWEKILGFRPSIEKATWQSIKALSRRVALFQEDEFRELRPVSDLIRNLIQHIRPGLKAPVRWELQAPGPEQEEESQRVVDEICQKVFAKLHGFARRHLIDDPLADWKNAFSLRGPGTTQPRAEAIRSLYQTSAPLLSETPDEIADAFRQELQQLVKEAVIESGGTVGEGDRPA